MPPPPALFGLNWSPSNGSLFHSVNRKSNLVLKSIHGSLKFLICLHVLGSQMAIVTSGLFPQQKCCLSVLLHFTFYYWFIHGVRQIVCLWLILESCCYIINFSIQNGDDCVGGITPIKASWSQNRPEWIVVTSHGNVCN